MNVKVVYHSRGGNTYKLAQAVAKGAGVPAEKVPGAAISEKVDLLFVGGGLYAGKLDKELVHFLTQLTPDRVGRVAVFGSSAAGKSLGHIVAGHLRGIPVEERDYAGKGAFLLANRGRPNADDLREAEAFGRSFIG